MDVVALDVVAYRRMRCTLLTVRCGRGSHSLFQLCPVYSVLSWPLIQMLSEQCLLYGEMNTNDKKCFIISHFLITH